MALRVSPVASRRPGRRLVAPSGLLAALLVVAATCVSAAIGLLPGVPLLDGLAPPDRYRWVQPPPELQGGNQVPERVTTTVALTGTVSPATTVFPATTVSTPDNQVEVILPAGAVDPPVGQSRVQVSIAPLDPAAVTPTPPGLAIQGNAYRIGVTYQPSGAAVATVLPVNVLLRYPVDATEVIRLTTTGAWQSLPTTLESAAEIVDGQATSFGVFAAALSGVAPTRPARTPAWAYAAAGLALLAAGIPALRRRGRRG